MSAWICGSIVAGFVVDCFIVVAVVVVVFIQVCFCALLPPMLVKCILEIMLALILTLLGIFIILDAVTMAPPKNSLDLTSSGGSGRYNIEQGKRKGQIVDQLR